MKSSRLISSGIILGVASAFHPPQNGCKSNRSSSRSQSRPLASVSQHSRKKNTALYSYIDTSEWIQRDLSPMISWCETYGVQHIMDFAPTSNYNRDLPKTQSEDMTCVASSDLLAGTPVLSVPSSLFLSSYIIKYEEFGELTQAEEFLTNLREPLPLFYLYVKLLYEYTLGDESPYYDWLNSLPRHYDTGTSMTPVCYDCLPPLAATYAKTERVRYINYKAAAKTLTWLQVNDDLDVCKWVFNVVSTRSWEMPDGSGERVIVPMADMFNHHYDPEIEIYYDEEGSCVAYTTKDVSAGSELRMSYGFDTNPSALFAKYGFIDIYAPATFWKYMDIIPSTELCAIGLSYSRMLFYPTGDIAPEVFDVLTYIILGEKNRQEQKAFYDAVLNGEDDTKNAFLGEYYYQIYDRIKKHVDKFLVELQELEKKAMNVDAEVHPRIGMIREHNEFVKGIFLTVKDSVDAVLSQVA